MGALFPTVPSAHFLYQPLSMFLGRLGGEHVCGGAACFSDLPVSGLALCGWPIKSHLDHTSLVWPSQAGLGQAA